MIALSTPDDLAPLAAGLAGNSADIAALRAKLAALGSVLSPPGTPAPGITGLLDPNRILLKDYSFGTTRWGKDIATLQTEFDFCYPNGDRTLSGNQECQLYALDGSAHILTPSTLQLTATIVPGKTIVGTTAFNVADRGSISSGMLSTKRTFKYGYFETRVKMPPAVAKGAFPAFWMTVGKVVNGHTSWWPPETDFFEVANNSGSATVDDGNGNPFFGMFGGTQVLSKLTNQWNSYHTGVDLGTIYCTFGCEWVPDPRGDRWLRYIMMDGHAPVLVNDMIYPWVYSDGSQAAPGHVYLNLAYGGTWSGRNGIDPVALAAKPALEVDYLRIFA